MTVLLGWILPLFAGTGIYVAINRWTRVPGHASAALGNGFFIGLFLVALLSHLLAGGQTSQAFVRVAPWIGAIGVGAWVAAWFLRMRAGPVIRVSLSNAVRLLVGIIAVLIVARLWLIADEASLRPVFPWDAWSAWSVKPKTWYLLDRFVPYVDSDTWLATPAIAARTSAVWDYPELMAWIEVWFASASGAWNEPHIHLAWTGALAALTLASYGQWRALGVGVALASVLAYGLVSLPLIDTHAALAGYVDLWLAAVFGLAVLAWLRWVRGGGTAQLLLAVMYGLLLPMIKLEGAVWLLILSVVAGLAAIPPRWRWKVTVLALLLLVAGIALGGFVFPMLGLGWVGVQWGEVVVPALGALDLHWRPGGMAMLTGLFTLPNWHLFWYLVPVVVAWRWRALVNDAASARIGAMLATCVVFLFVLFFFTDAAAWAENYTSANRLVLHVVPAVFTLLALLLCGLSEAPRDTDRAPLAQTGPG